MNKKCGILRLKKREEPKQNKTQMSESRKHSRDGADFDRAITDSLNSVGG